MVRVRNLFQKDLKNRSSKNLLCLTKHKPFTWSLSTEALEKLSSQCDSKGNIYETELNRRSRNASKRKTPRPTKK